MAPHPSPLILVIGQTPDVHIDATTKALYALGAKVVCLHRRSLAHTLTFQANTIECVGHTSTPEGTFPLDAFTGVWWRIKPQVPSEFAAGEASIAEQFTTNEWRKALRSLPVFTQSATWVNPLLAHESIDHKPYQLRLAQEVGLSIPDTIISNCIEDIFPLFARNKEVVYKPLHSFMAPPDQVIYTVKIPQEDLEKSRSSFGLAPGIFQGYVEKHHELRVTVVGKDVFVGLIDSQSNEATQTDWRTNQMRPMYQKGKLTDATIHKLLAFHARAGLVYGAYDFIVDKDGREVFLECNPGGQWLWIEQAVGVPIADAMARALIKDSSA